MDINEKLKELTKDVLSEESLNEIASAFEQAVEARATLQVESALAQQDEDHASKVKELLEAIDKDHTEKLEKLVEAIDSNHTDKLKNVVSRYETVLGEEANKFKGQMINNVSNYLELYLEETIPANSIKEAAKNRKSDELLQSIREQLGVDLALAKKSIKNAVVDGKKQIDEAKSVSDAAVQEKAELEDRLNKLETELVLEKKTSGLPEAKRKHMFKVLGDKSAEFITENFDYTLKLYEKGDVEQADILQEQAQASATTVDRPVETDDKEVVAESNNPAEDSDQWADAPFRGDYMQELRRF